MDLGVRIAGGIVTIVVGLLIFRGLAYVLRGRTRKNAQEKPSRDLQAGTVVPVVVKKSN